MMAMIYAIDFILFPLNAKGFEFRCARAAVAWRQRWFAVAGP
ncbi:hypothetical protein [Chromobacterium subtsugae]|nr:hypothetical protein [Chromobacterium subtsugae]